MDRRQPEQGDDQLAAANNNNSTPNRTRLDETLAAAANRKQQATILSDGNQRPTTANAKVDTSERLRALRQLLVSNNYDAYLVTPNDEHGSEYVSDYDRRLRFISGFTGSNGYALITLDAAVLFTDGRYELQAERDLDCNWALVVSGNQLFDISNWVRAHLLAAASSSRRGAPVRLATDARLMSLQVFDFLDTELRRPDSSAFEFVLISQDLIDGVWNSNINNSNNPPEQNGDQVAAAARPRPAGPLSVHQLEFAGQTSWQDKVLRLAELMARSQARHYAISKLDDIAWLLNLRGSDIPMAPLFKAYLLVSRQPVSGGGPALAHQPNGGRPAGDQQAAASRLAAGSSSSSSSSAGPSGQFTLEQLLAGAHDNKLQAPQQQQTDSLTLQSPQLVQTPPSQLIKLTLYVDLRKITPQVREHLHLDAAAGVQLQSNGSGSNLHGGEQFGETRIQVELKDYDAFISEFGERFRLRAAANQPPSSYNAASGQQLPDGPLAAGAGGEQQPAGGRLLLDAMANVAIHVLAKHYDDRLILVEPLCQRLKSVKNELEVNGMRQAHWRDSLAIAMLLSQLEQDIGVLKQTDKWTEVSAANELEFYRSLMDHNRGQSFDTISAYGPNAAIVHYQPDLKAPAAVQVRIGNESTYLLDSGGQYLDGTTDITRTVHFGQPSDFQRDTYTRVLMGAIDMMSLVFEMPAKHSSYRISDLLARRHLFDIGRNYEHGTGHGIGLYSLVHEEPALIVNYQEKVPLQVGGQSKLTAGGKTHPERSPIRENMFTSVEPGYYEPNSFGIRLENIVVTQRLAFGHATNQQRNNQSRSSGEHEREWLRFEPISLVPFEPKLIKFELLSNKQKAWLNSYNLMVRLRMTQQINYYLMKVRQAQQQVQVLGTTSASRLYKNLQPAAADQTPGSNKDAAGSQATRKNFMRMEPNKLQQLLEQAHRWIMSKTELIHLDVPQGLRQGHESMAAAGRRQQTPMEGRRAPPAPPTTGGQSSADGKPASEERPDTPAGRRADGDEWSALSGRPDGQRLMLAYMASLPFNDASAARAVANSMTGRDQAALKPNGGQSAGDNDAQSSSATPAGSGTSQNNDGGPSTSKSSAASEEAQAFGRKCTGIECDLLLLEALSSHQRSIAGDSRTTTAPPGQESPSVADDSLHQKDGHQQPFVDLFQLRSSSAPAGGFWWSLVANTWPVLGLAVIVVLQLAVVVYVCGTGRAETGRIGGSHGGNASTANELDRRRASIGAGAVGPDPSPTGWVMSSGSGSRRCSPGRFEPPSAVSHNGLAPGQLGHEPPPERSQQLPVVVSGDI
jgi:Xaa-Pro aminopeptidase